MLHYRQLSVSLSVKNQRQRQRRNCPPEFPSVVGITSRGNVYTIVLQAPTQMQMFKGGCGAWLVSYPCREIDRRLTHCLVAYCALFSLRGLGFIEQGVARRPSQRKMKHCQKMNKLSLFWISETAQLLRLTSSTTVSLFIEAKLLHELTMGRAVSSCLLASDGGNMYYPERGNKAFKTQWHVAQCFGGA